MCLNNAQKCVLFKCDESAGRRPNQALCVLNTHPGRQAGARAVHVSIQTVSPNSFHLAGLADGFAVIRTTRAATLGAMKARLPAGSGIKCHSAVRVRYVPMCVRAAQVHRTEAVLGGIAPGQAMRAHQHAPPAGVL